jgi:hypothetical protein
MKAKIFLVAAFALARISAAQTPSATVAQTEWQLGPPFEKIKIPQSSSTSGVSTKTAPSTAAAPATSAAPRDHKDISAMSYVEGSIWVLTFVKTKPGSADDYFKSISASLKPVYEEEKKQKMILDYKILSTDAGDDRDFNVIIMVEYPNMAALEGSRERVEPILDKIIGSGDARRAMATKRLDVREILASKTMREIWLK